MDRPCCGGATGPSFSDLITAVEDWAAARDILQHSTPTAQLMKTVSELGELADATMHDDTPNIIDGIGDVLVTLIIYARLQDLSLTACLQSAYDTIKDRKGRLTASGVFLKETTAEIESPVDDDWALADALKKAHADDALAELSEIDRQLEVSRPACVITAKSGTVYQLFCTCFACPEQYDVKTPDGATVGYLRLRHGHFRADCPDVGGDTVYSSTPKGDGVFDDDERVGELTAAVNAIDAWWETVRNESRAPDTSAR